jgi:ribosomal protein L37E
MEEETVPVCIRCGAALNATAKFCGMCGYPVKNNNQTVSPNSRTQNNSSSQKPNIVVCIRCGKKRKLSDNLCWNCGCKNQEQLGLAGSNTASQQMWTKEQYIAELDRLIAYFSKVQSWYDAHDSYIKRRNEMEKELGDYSRIRRPRHREDEDLLESLSNGTLKDVALFLWIFSASSIQVILLFFIGYSTKNLFASLLISIGCLGLCVILICVGVLLWKKRSEEEAKLREELKQVNSTISYIYKTLWDYYKKYGICLLGFEDTNPRKIKMIIDYMKSGKANTVEKAKRMANKALR